MLAIKDELGTRHEVNTIQKVNEFADYGRSVVEAEDRELDRSYKRVVNRIEEYNYMTNNLCWVSSLSIFN